MGLWLISCLDYSYYMIFLIWIYFWWICWKIGFMQRVWLHKRTCSVYLSIASKGLAITGIDDWRYWNHIPTEEPRWDSFNFLTLFFLVFMYWFFNGNGRKLYFSCHVCFRWTIETPAYCGIPLLEFFQVGFLFWLSFLSIMIEILNLLCDAIIIASGFINHNNFISKFC